MSGEEQGDVVQELLNVASPGFPTRINRQRASELVGPGTPCTAGG